MTQSPHYIDPRNGATYDLAEPRWRSDAGHPLMISDLPGIGRDEIETGTRSIWRYRAALPMSFDAITLGEGCTPLVTRSFGGHEFLFKLEWFAPTSSFKDRGASVMVSYLRQCGVPKILEDSSGNGGAAVAAYAAAGGIEARILAPATTQPPKIAQMRAFGAEVQLVPGPRDECEREAIRQSDSIFYASHNWQPFFVQGTKLLAYELWEDLGFRAPDAVVIPTGSGSNVLGLDIGFQELLRAGQIDKVPRLYAVQPTNVSPVDASFKAGSAEILDVRVAPTVAEGTAIRRPVRGREVLQALRRTGGGSVAIEEAAIIDGVRRLAASGLYVEPTCATAAVAAERLLAAGSLRSGETNVVLLTGTGLKASALMTEWFAHPV